MNSIIVKKLGWENSAELQGTFENIEKDFSKNKKQVIVLSALKADGNVINDKFNVSDMLIEAWDCLGTKKKKKYTQAFWIINEVQNFHIEMIEEKLWKKSTKATQYIKQVFENVKQEMIYYVKNDKKVFIPWKGNDYSISTKSNTPLSLLWLW